jgi:hypothetical protein
VHCMRQAVKVVHSWREATSNVSDAYLLLADVNSLFSQPNHSRRDCAGESEASLLDALSPCLG